MSFSKEIIEIFDYIGNKFGIAIDWSNENVMPYLQELCGKYISWEIATSVIWIIIGMIPLLICIPVYKEYKKALEVHKGNYYNDDYFYWFLVICVLLFIAISTIGGQIFDIVKCVCFPELQIYEYISTLISTS